MIQISFVFLQIATEVPATMTWLSLDLFYKLTSFFKTSNKRLLVAYTRAAVINSVQQAKHVIAEQINQGQPHTQS